MTQFAEAVAGDGAAGVDLSNCDREPIHIPGSVQPHGLLLALREPDLMVTRASANAEAFCGVPVHALLGQGLNAVLKPGPLADLRQCLSGQELEDDALYLCTLPAGREARPFNAIAHRSGDELVLELEPAAVAGHAGSFQNTYGVMRTSLARLRGVTTIDQLCDIAVGEVRRLTGFDRVMVYRFDRGWNGEVIAEDRRADLPPFLGLHFPASDIPAQARRLYTVNRLRLIADVGYEPVPVVSNDDGKPLDMSHCVLRSVSPIHVEYLKNMGVAASMSISIIKEGQLWGLIACHHTTPRFLPFEVRAACDALGQVLSMQLTDKGHSLDYEQRVRLKSLQTRLLEHMTSAATFREGLTGHGRDLVDYVAAQGAALYDDGEVHLIGQTPTEAQVRQIVNWLAECDLPGGVCHTDALPADFPPAHAFAAQASGLLAVSISQVHRTYVMWFRPEVVRTVTWSGDPHQPATVDGNHRLHPRKSFEQWKETVRGKSLPWQPYEIDAAADLRNTVVGIVLKRAEELAGLTADLQRSNRELESFSYSVSHDLRAPFRHIVGFADLLNKRAAAVLDDTGRRYVQTIMESARYAGHLVDSLLAFSQMGRAALRRTDVDMAAVVDAERRQLAAEAAGRDVRWRVGDLPPALGDPTMLQLAWRNLLHNAVKYTRTRPHAEIEVGGRVEDGRLVYWVRDNGVGFDMEYVGKLFGVFQRLHRAEDFEGTGIGLANVRRIVERHGGRAWAEGAPDQGATFYFSLPAELAPNGNTAAAAAANRDGNRTDTTTAAAPRAAKEPV